MHWQERKRYSRSFLLMLLSVVCAGRSSAQADAYSSTLWRTSAGLPENFVQAILADGDEQLWVATTGGLSRFDGTSFTTLSEDQLAGLSVNSFSCLTRSHDGSLWAGTEGGGLVHIAGSKSEIFDSRSGLGDQYVRSIYEDSGNRLWIGTDGGLFLKTGMLFKQVHFGVKGARQDVHDIIEDAEHQIYVGGSLLWKLRPTGDQVFRLAGADSQNLIKVMLIARDGALWVGTPTGLYRQEGKSFRRVVETSVGAVIEARDGTIWVGTNGSGLMTYRDGKVASVDPQDRQLRAVLSLVQDRDGRIWVGTKSGLLRLQRTSVQVVPLPIPGTEFGTVTNKPDGNVSIVAHGVFDVSVGQARMTNLNGLNRAYPINMVYARDGSVWLGTLLNGVYHISPGGTEHYSTQSAQPITGDAPRGMLETQQGDLWVATGFGLNRIRDRHVTQYGTADGLPSRNIRSIFEDRSHCIWIGTEAGLAHMCGGRLLRDAATDALRGEKVWVTLQDRHGAMWFGTRDHGLYRFRGGQVLHLTTADGLFSNTVYGLLQDASGKFWMSSPETITSISESDMENAKGDRTKFLAVTYYSMPQGFEGTEFAGGRFPSGVIAKDNSAWFVSDEGAVHIAQEVNDPVHVPLAVVTNVSVDGAALPTSGKGRIRATAKRIQFDFATHFLGPQKEMQLMYRLNGLDSTWTTAGQSRTVEYGALAPGNYRFEVRAFLRKQPDQYTLASYSLVSQPIWYKTRWAIASFFLITFLIALLAYVLRLRRLRSRFRLILEERNRLAREMHDTVIQGCNGVSMLLEAVASHNIVSGDGKLLGLARSQIQATIGEAREAVWGLRNTELRVGHLNESLQQLAQQAQESLGVPVLREHYGKTPKMYVHTAHELVMIAREAIANAGNHAKPTQIHVKTILRDRAFRLEIEDDGCGFRVEEYQGLRQGHYGLVGMRERAEKIHAKFSIISALGQGTRIHIEISESQFRSGKQRMTNDGR